MKTGRDVSLTSGSQQEEEDEEQEEEREDQVMESSTFSPLMDTSLSQEVCDSDRKCFNSIALTPEEV